MNPEPTPEELAQVRDETRHDGKDLRAKAAFLPDIHKLLPQSPEAEQGTLGSILLFPVESVGMCEEKRITAEYFHIPAHALIYTACCRIVNEGKPLDFITLAGYLRDRQKLDAVGGAAFLSGLFTFVPTATLIGYYIAILCEKYMLRRMIMVGTEYASRCYIEQDEPGALLDNFERETLSIRGELAQTKMVSTRVAVMEAIGDIQSMYENRGKVSGIETGFSMLDQTLNGLQPEMIVLAARPGVGKTGLAMNIAEFISVDLGLPVLFFSLEMSRRQLFQRYMASRAKVNLQAIRNGFLSERDFPALTAAASKIAGSPFYLDDSSELTIEEIRGRSRRMKRENGIKAIFVDYLQLVKSMSRRAKENRAQEVAEVSGGLKAMSKELQIPVVALCQIGRDFEKRGAATSRPRMSDLKESSAIEADADTIMFLVRPEMHAETDEEREELRGKAELMIVKQRMGPQGDIPLTFIREHTRFEQRAGHYDEADSARNTTPDLPL